MQSHHEDPDRPIKLGLLAVIGFMAWPVWAAIIAGMQSFNWAAAASALVPLVLSLAAPALWLNLPQRIGDGTKRLEHALHVDNLIHHGHTHRHA